MVSTNPPKTMTNVDHCKLTIQGRSDKSNFIIDGNCGTMRVDSSNMDQIHFTKTDGVSGVESTKALISILGGNVTIDKTSLWHSWVTKETGGAIGAGTTGSIGDYGKCPIKVKMTNSDIKWCRTYLYGAAINFFCYVSGSTFEIEDCVIWYTDTYGGLGQEGSCGGAIRSMGANLCELSMTRCKMHHNYTMGHGGAIRWHSALIDPVELTDCEIYRNWARVWGGGIRTESGMIFDNCKIRNNRAGEAGGGISFGSCTSVSTGHLQNAGVYDPSDPQGGWYPPDGILDLDANTVIKNNTAGNYGGGIHIFAKFVSITADPPYKIYLNKKGDPYKMGFSMNGTTIQDNTAGQHGGAVYISRDTEYYGIDVKLNEGTLNHNTATAGNGGSFCVTEDITVPYDPSSGHDYQPIQSYIGTDDSSVTGNLTMTKNTAVNGGGMYVGKGNVTVYGNAVVGGTSSTYANKSNGGDGGGLYVNNGNFTLSGGEISYNQAKASGGDGGNGGGVYVNSGDVTVTSGNLNYNEADAQGGGFYCNGAVTFSNGNINYNKATQDGGGIYIPSTGTLTVSGAATMTGNNATSGWGGGVYQGGIMIADGNSLTITGNTKGTAKALSNNNVYLPNTKTIKVLGDIDPTGVNLGIYTENEAVEGGDGIPVLTADAEDEDKLEEIYDALLDGSSKITDDREVHKAKYPGAALYTLYFAKISYDYGVFTDSEPFSNPINSPLQLYKYMCWVNGLNGFSTKHENALGNVTADIDMSGVTHWIPIGEKENSGAPTIPFEGTFNGNGHTISGLAIDATEGYTNYGLFGKTQGATISGVQIHDCNMTKSSADGSLGAIVGTMSGGSLSGCVASGTLTTTASGCSTGGLVGKLESSGTIHSSCAMPDLTGYQMGGLVGSIASGCNLYNSFANALFTVQSGNTQYQGGLVGVNSGRIENCYVRGSWVSGLHYGWLVGNNDGGTITYSYIKDGATIYKCVGTEVVNTCTTFGETQTPYLYKHADNQMTANEYNTYIDNGSIGTIVGGNDIALKGLLATLNNWVTLNGSSTYTKWMRTSASPINDDYPILKYDNAVCVASRDNRVLEYTSDFNTKFNKYVTASSGAGVGTIFLYKTPEVIDGSGATAYNVNVSNYGKATALYIDEHVALKPYSSKAAGDIEATVGISLDNSAGLGGAHPTQTGTTDAIDWHMFSTSLADAPLGVNYNGDAAEWGFSWGAPPAGMPLYSFYAEGNANHGYFPSKEYGTNADYYYDWDYYAYFEPEYHWINFKRNGNSHWHEDYTTVKINYSSNGTGADWTNESTLIKGRGYLVATKEPTYLQCSGTLNKGTVNVYVSSGAWQRKGYNLLGNPYQSYLDFDAFAQQNKALWGITDTDYSTAYYFILDEDQKGYIKYAYGASGSSYTAPRCLHPHQGFMVIAENDMTVQFTEAMRNTTATGVTFRGNEGMQPSYPLVNLIATEANGNRDVCTVELGRPDKGGARVQREMRISRGLVYCHYDDEDWSIAFTQPGLTEAAIRFETVEDAEFTMTWDVENGDFSYLHLIDNMTGADIDCLRATEYRFSSKTSDYASRFRLLFDYTGVEENGQDGPSTGSGTFAFQMGDELVVNGEGRLEMIDLLGRVIKSETLDGVQSTTALPATAGVYVLRLTGKDGVRVQKMIVE